MRFAMAMTVGAVCAAGSLGSTACVIKPDSSQYAEAIPQTNDAILNVKGSSASSGAQGQSVGSVRIATNGPGGPTSTGYAEFYQFTRDISDGVDIGTLYILGAIDLVVHTPATSVDGKTATWGPGGSALDPINWKLTVSEVGDHEYDWNLEGRPHGSAKDSDFVSIVSGHGYGSERAEHRSGWFLIDNDAFRRLDPARGHDSGTVKVTFDARTWPTTIRAEAKHTTDNEWFDVTVTHQRDGSGAVDIKALADIDRPADGVPENAILHSRWNATGAGRADVDFMGGDIKVPMATASECWGSDFMRTYYTDNVNYKPTEGDPSSCVFPQASF